MTTSEEKNQAVDEKIEEQEEATGEGHEGTFAEEMEESNTEQAQTDLKSRLEEAEQRANENYQKYLRAQADFDNFRKRTRQEKEAQAKYASLPLIEKLLPALDNFERALAASQGSQDLESITKGVEMVFRQLEQVLQEEGLEAIPTVGEAFDPNVHQAVMQEESSEYDSGVVIEEFQKGYKVKDKVIRPAMVKVNS